MSPALKNPEAIDASISSEKTSASTVDSVMRKRTGLTSSSIPQIPIIEVCHYRRNDVRHYVPPGFFVEYCPTLQRFLVGILDPPRIKPGENTNVLFRLLNILRAKFVVWDKVGLAQPSSDREPMTKIPGHRAP